LEKRDKTMPAKITYCFLVALLFGASVLTPVVIAASNNIPIFDAHNQVDEGLTADEVISLMDAAGVQRTFFASRNASQDALVLEAAERYPNRILPLIRSKGDSRFEASITLFKEQLDRAGKDGHYFGLAELLVYHAIKPALHMMRERKIFLNDQKVALAVDLSERKKWPLILHIEMAAAGDLRQRYMDQLEKFLNDHPNLPVLMIHMAQLDAPDVERLIQSHANIYFMTSTVKFLTSDSVGEISTGGGQPWTTMFRDGALLDSWRELFIRYPDRFVYASDNVILKNWRRKYRKMMHIWQRTFQELAPEVAHKVAHQNAERLWHLEEATNQRMR
jgi:predicted TIM-barrel fold metal-dependent hydrolase